MATGSTWNGFAYRLWAGQRRPALVASLVVVFSLAASAVPAAASTYFFLPGDPTFYGGAGKSPYCTGGYAIRGTSGMFLLTDDHCRSVHSTVYGTDRAFGTVAYTKGPASDSALISETPPDDAYQIVHDPHTGRTPGTGRVVGYFASSSFDIGMVVGKMGWTTGWTEGTITGTTTWRNMTAWCGSAYTQPGDSGGPVWQSRADGVYALGITVAYNTSTGGGCFLGISDLLSLWGAWLPVFPPGSRLVTRGTAAGGTGTQSQLPHIDPALLVPA